MSKKNKTNMDVIDVQNLYDFKAFKDKDYINFIKRSGGQVFQYYSLLDSYANFLGANGGSEFASDYRETEVTFSREIYKKRVYSSVVLPLYSSDSSTNSIQIALGSNNPGGEGTGSYDDLTYFKPRVTPSWYDRHINSLSFVGGDFRNIYRQATSKVESMTTKSISFITGEFRLPLLTYIHREHESSTTTYLVFIDGSLKKVLLKALIPTESFQTKDMSCYAMAKSTVVEKDILELNFLDLNYVSESPKATPKVLDKFSTKISSPPEPKYLRILNKRGGIRLDFTNNSISVTPYFDWTVNFNFEPKELRTDSHIVDYGNQIKVRLDSRDPSKLIVEVSGQKLYTSLPGFITTNRWFNISIEKKGSEYSLYINKELMATESLDLGTFFSEGTSLTLGNSADTYNGFIGNVSDFIIVKRAALLTDDLFAEHHSIKPVIGSELDFSTGTVKDKNPNIIWTNVNTALYNEEAQGLVFNAGQYLVAEDAPDLSIYNFNNYRIDVEFSLSEVPSLANKVKTLIHKTGVLSGGYSTESGYSLSVERVDDNARLRFRMGRVSILSSTVIRLGFRYSVELIKYKTQLLMFINNVYEGSVLLDAPLDEDIISNLIIGRFQSIPERDFKGIIHALKFTNYFKDLSGSDRYMKYLPENLEYEEILNFEEKSLVWIESNKDINPEDYLSKSNPKFGEQSLELNDTNKAIIRPNTPLYNFTTADFTIEGWFKPTSFRDQNIIISNGVVEDSNNTILLQYLYLDSLGFVNFYADKTITGLISNTLIKSNKAVVLNTWSHIVFTRTKGVFRIYINGEITAQVIANNITIDLSINNTFIGNNNFKGSTSSKTEEPPLSTYVDKPNPTNKESLDITMDKGGILAIPSTPESVWDAVTGVLTVGESGFIANTEAEKAALKKLHDLKYLSKEDIKDLPVLVVLDWIQQEELTMKEKPPVIVIPPSEAVLKSQYNGYIDSFRILKDESKYSGDSFEVPGLPFGDSNTNLIAHLTFDHQSSSNLEKELLLEFEPAPSISKVDSVVVNAETLTNFKEYENLETFDNVIFNFDEGLINEGNFPQELNPGSITINQTVTHMGSKVLNSAYKGFTVTSTDPAKNIFMFEGQDFTIDTWIYETSEPSGGWWKIFDNGYPTYTSGSPLNSLGQTLGFNKTNNTFRGIAGMEVVDNARQLLPLNKWNHLAVSKEENTLRLFINGIKVSESIVDDSYSNFNTGSGLVFLGSGWGSTEYLRGYVSNLRIVRGKALFTKDFDTMLLTKPEKTLSNVLKDDFIPEKNTDVVKTDTLFSDRNIKFVDSGILFNDTSSKVLDNVRPEQDFSLEFYIRFNTSVNRYQTLLSNVQEERHLSHYFNIYRYGEVLENPGLTNKLAITKNPGDLSDTLFISEQKFRDDIWYNITIIKVNSYVKLFINGLLDSKVYLPELSVLFSGVGFRLGNSFVADTAMTGNLESFRYTPRLSIYKNSFDPENIYLTEENSEKYIFTEDPTKIYDSFSKKIITDLPNANTTLEDGNLVTRLPENTSKTGITLPANLPSLGIAKEDFTIETKVYLEANRNRRYTDVFCNRASADSSATYLNVSNSSNANGAVFISSVNFYIRQNSVEMNFGENSFTENAWNTICVTRQGDTLRGYVNGSLKVTKDLTNTPNVDLKLNTYGGLRIFDSGQTQAGVMDYFYILRGQALYTEDTYIPGPIDVKHTKFEERYVPAQNDKTSVLPFKTFVENLYTKNEDFAPVTDEESLIKSSLKLNSNTYIKLNFLPRIPKDFMVGFWIKPKFNSSVSNSYMYSIFKWESDDEYKIEYFINKLGQDKLVISKGSLTATVGGYNHTGPQLIVDEWNHIIITKFDDTVTFYYNGYKFKTFNDPKYREMDSNLNSSFYLGYNSAAETDSMVVLVDDVKIFKYREGNFLDLYYNSLETLLEESKIKVTEIPILNSDGSSDLDYWDDTDNHIQSSFIASLGKYYFNSKSPSSTYRHASQMIDVSEYLDLSNNKFFFSWTQSYNEAYATSDNKAECVLYLYNEDERLLRLINPLATDIRTSVSQDREIERYFIDHLPVGTKYVKVKFSLKNHSYITNMKLFVENTGEKFSNFDYLEEYIPPMSIKTHSHALLLSHTNEEYLKRTQAAEIEITPQMFELGTPKGNINILPLNVTEEFKGSITNITALEVESKYISEILKIDINKE